MTALPKLERLLLDADLDVEIRPYLDAVGFQTRFALEIDADERSDVALLRWARENNYILVCHDKFRDRTTRLELYPELNSNGGRILRITGDSSQDVITAAGKIIVNREKWLNWFEDNNGLVILKSDGVLYRRADELYQTVQRHHEAGDLADRIRARKRTPSNKRPSHKVSTEQSLQMNLSLDEDAVYPEHELEI